MTSPTASSSAGQPLELQVLGELNNARTNPKAFASRMAECRAFYSRDKLFSAPGKIPIRTNEGVAALDEAIAHLNRIEPRAALTYSRALGNAARDHALDGNANGHTGSDGSKMSDRISRYGTWQSSIGENIDYGSNNAFEIVMHLLVDDGVSSRGHRENILNPSMSMTVAVAL
jgi:uncharacterized protein YkwD